MTDWVIVSIDLTDVTLVNDDTYREDEEDEEGDGDEEDEEEEELI